MTEREQTPAELDAVIEKTVTATLLKIGINVTDGESIVEFQSDMRHIRRARLTSEKVGERTLIVVLTSTLGAVITALVFGFQSIIASWTHHGGPPSPPVN